MTKSLPSKRLPFLIAALGMFLLCLMDALIKTAATRYPTMQVVAMRFGCALPLIAILLAVTRPGVPTRAMTRAHLVRGFLVFTTASLFFFALSAVPLAEAVALSFLAPLFLAIFAWALLGERIHSRVWGALALGFVGMGAIVGAKVGGGDLSTLRLLGALAAVGCAVTYAANLVLLRQRAQQDPMATIIAFQHFVPAVIAAPFAHAVWVTPTAEDWMLFAGMAGLGLLGHSCLVWAFARAKAGPLGVIEYSALVWASALGWIFFAEIPGFWTIAGALLIIGACLFAAGRDSEKPISQPA